MDYFGSRPKSPKSPSTGGSTPRPPFRFNDEIMYKNIYSHWTFFLMQMLSNLGAKRNFVFFAPTPCPKNVPEPLTVPIADVLLCYVVRICVSFLLFCIRAQGILAMQLLVVNGKIKNFMLLNSVPPPTFSIVLHHCSSLCDCAPSLIHLVWRRH